MRTSWRSAPFWQQLGTADTRPVNGCLGAPQRARHGRRSGFSRKRRACLSTDGPAIQVDSTTALTNNPVMRWMCHTIRLLLASLAWLSLLCQQAGVACGCCTTQQLARTADRSGPAETPCCEHGETNSQPQSTPRPSDKTGHSCCPPSTATQKSDCCGSCCEDTPENSAVPTSRLPVPAIDGVLSPVDVNNSVCCLSRAATGSTDNRPPVLKQRLALLCVWRN